MSLALIVMLPFLGAMLPALMIREGFRSEFRPVNHRHRQTGRS